MNINNHFKECLKLLDDIHNDFNVFYILHIIICMNKIFLSLFLSLILIFQYGFKKKNTFV